MTLHIIKIGGNIIDDENRLEEFLRRFSLVPGPKILVHGGGKLATEMAGQLGIKQQMVDGRRITDAETLKVVTMVYAGYINKNIVAKLQALGCNAIGLTGADANLLSATKRGAGTVDYGFVGDVEPSRFPKATWKTLIGQGFIPVMAPITHNGEGQLLNTNADTIAGEIGKGLAGEFEVTLVYCFEKAGVLTDVNDDSTLVSNLSPATYASLKEKGLIFAGMIPKLDNAFAAIAGGIKKVIIGKAEQFELVLAGTSGTTITNE